jgi:hypothetical protein
MIYLELKKPNIEQRINTDCSGAGEISTSLLILP